VPNFVWGLFGWTAWTVINTAVVSSSLECDYTEHACALRPSTEKLLVNLDPGLYFFINQGCLTVDHMDDKEEMQIVEVYPAFCLVFFYSRCKPQSRKQKAKKTDFNPLRPNRLYVHTFICSQSPHKCAHILESITCWFVFDCRLQLSLKGLNGIKRSCCAVYLNL